MRIYLCDTSARVFWRSEHIAGVDAYPPSRFPELVKCARNESEIKAVDTYWLPIGDGKPHLMVPGKSFRSSPASFCYHVFSGKLPRGAFRKVASDIYLSSPEFCFVQAAGSMTLPRLIEYADELCGAYAQSRACENGFWSRTRPLTTVAQLMRFAEDIDYARNISSARRALKYVVDGSASPAETSLEMLLCLPRLLGGAGLPRAEMNYELQLPAHAARMAGKGRYRCDLAWPQQHVAVEYNSKRYHSDNAQVTADDIRKNVLQHCGMRVIVAKPYHLYDYRGFLDLEMQIAQALGFRRRPLTDKQHEARVQLRRQLLGRM